MNTKIYQDIINDSNKLSNVSNVNPNTSSNETGNETCTLSLILLKLHQAETREMLLLEKIEKLKKMLEKKLDTINTIEKNTQRMEDHINFVEKTYEKVKTPFHFLMDKVNTLPFLSYKKSEIENKEEK